MLSRVALDSLCSLGWPRTPAFPIKYYCLYLYALLYYKILMLVEGEKQVLLTVRWSLHVLSNVHTREMQFKKLKSLDVHLYSQIAIDGVAVTVLCWNF